MLHFNIRNNFDLKIVYFLKKLKSFYFKQRRTNYYEYKNSYFLQTAAIVLESWELTQKGFWKAQIMGVKYKIDVIGTFHS